MRKLVNEATKPFRHASVEMGRSNGKWQEKHMFYRKRSPILMLNSQVNVQQIHTTCIHKRKTSL